MAIWRDYNYITRALVWSNDSVVGKCLFLGCDEHLYKYNIQTDSYELCGSLSSNRYIKRLWVNTQDNNYIYGAAWDDLAVDASTVSVDIFKYDGSSLTELTTLVDVFTGEFCYRKSAYESAYSTRIGETKSENISLPFKQRLKTFGLCDYISVQDSINDDAESITSFTSPEEKNAGYYFVGKIALTTFYAMMSYGQRGALELYYKSGGKGRIAYATLTTSLNYYDINGDVTGTTIADWKYDNKKFYPTCLYANTSAGEPTLLFGGVCWHGTISGYEDSRSYLIQVNSGGTDSIEYVSTGDTSNAFRVFLDIEREDSTYTLTYINRDKINTLGACGVGRYVLTNTNLLTSGVTTAGIPRGLCRSGISNTYYYTVNGFLYSYLNGVSSLLTTSSACVDDEPNIASNLSVVPYADINAIDVSNNRTEEIVFGVSAPGFPNDTQIENLMGKYYLWKYDNYLSDRIDLADFTGMNAWEAISKLSQTALGYFCGFDADANGSFFIANTSDISDVTALEVSDHPSNNNLISIEKSRGLDNIYNYCSIAPYESEIGQAEKEIFAVARADEISEQYRVSVDDMFIDVRIKHPLQVRLECVKEGDVNADYNAIEDMPLFKWQIFEEASEAMIIKGGAIGETEVIVASTFRGNQPTFSDANKNIVNFLEEAINVGDYCTFIDSPTQNEQIVRIDDITENRLTLKDALEFDVLSNTIVSISRGFDIAGETYNWSDDGVTTVISQSGSTIYTSSKRDISTNTILEYNGDYAVVTDVGDWSIASSGYSITTSGSSLSVSNGNILSGYFSPRKNSNGDYSYSEIGGLGIYIKIEPSGYGTQFVVGDRITVNTNGLELKQQTTSMQTSWDNTSIEDHGRSEYTGFSNRFLGRIRAHHFVHKIVQEYKDGHYMLKVTVPLDLDLSFIKTGGLLKLKLHHKKLFKKYDEISAYPKQITHNLVAGVTVLELRDINAY